MNITTQIADVFKVTNYHSITFSIIHLVNMTVLECIAKSICRRIQEATNKIAFIHY